MYLSRKSFAFNSDRCVHRRRAMCCCSSKTHVQLPCLTICSGVTRGATSHAPRLPALDSCHPSLLTMRAAPCRPGAGGEANREGFESAMKTVDATFQVRA
jgi:hypothetical protein